MISYIKKSCFFAIGFLLCIFISLSLFAYFIPNNLGGSAKTEIIKISQNETGANIAEVLAQKKLIASPEIFRIALKLTGTEGQLKAGYYIIPNNKSIYGIIDLMKNGRVESIRVTIPEGYTIQQIATRLEQEKVISKKEFLQEAATYVPYNYMYGPKPVKYHVEGFLFPDTYDIPIHTSARGIIDMMTKEMNSKLTPEVREKIKEKHLTIYQFVTLASIVEREALFDKDRPIIAGVFLKRMKIQMPLQSCATIEYLLGKRKPILSDSDVKVESPYNTYLYKGLPPGPISNPGLKSMDAVLNATDTDYLYFVSDPKGHQHFSKTYEEHLQVVKKIYGN